MYTSDGDEVQGAGAPSMGPRELVALLARRNWWAGWSRRASETLRKCRRHDASSRSGYGWSDFVHDSERNVDARHLIFGSTKVANLIIEEDVRSKHAQDACLLDTAEEEGVVHAQTPRLDRLDRALVGRSVSRGDDRYMKASIV